MLCNRAGILRNFAYIGLPLIFLIYLAVTLVFITLLIKEDYSLSVSVLMLLISILNIMIGIILLASRNIDDPKYILPQHLAVLPISAERLYTFILWDTTFNINTLGCIISLLLILFTVPESGLGIIVISSLTFILFPLFVVIWLANIYVIFIRLLIRYRQFFSVLPLMLVVAFQTVFVFKLIGEDTLRDANRIPVVGWIGAGFFSALDGNWVHSIKIVLLLAGLSILGLLAGIAIIRRYKHSLYRWD